DDHLKGIGLIGGKVVYNADYNPQGESNWAPFVDDLKRNGVQMLDFIGEPVNLQALQTAMSTAGDTPNVTITTPNFYDAKYAQEGGATATNTYVEESFYPFIPAELAKGNQATEDYLELMNRYNPGGKVAALGAQTLSSYLLFATAAAACGANLT